MNSIRDLLIFDEIVRIGTVDYEKTLFTKSGNYINEEARRIDEGLYCYVEPEIFKKSDEEIIEHISDNIDSEFPEIIYSWKISI